MLRRVLTLLMIAALAPCEAVQVMVASASADCGLATSLELCGEPGETRALPEDVAAALAEFERQASELLGKCAYHPAGEQVGGHRSIPATITESKPLVSVCIPLVGIMTQRDDVFDGPVRNREWTLSIEADRIPAYAEAVIEHIDRWRWYGYLMGGVPESAEVVG